MCEIKWGGLKIKTRVLPHISNKLPIKGNGQLMFVTVKNKTKKAQNSIIKGDESFIEVFLCVIGCSHIHCLLIQSCGWLLKVYRLISLTQKCHCTSRPATEHSDGAPVKREVQTEATPT